MLATVKPLNVGESPVCNCKSCVIPLILIEPWLGTDIEPETVPVGNSASISPVVTVPTVVIADCKKCSPATKLVVESWSICADAETTPDGKIAFTLPDVTVPNVVRVPVVELIATWPEPDITPPAKLNVRVSLPTDPDMLISLLPVAKVNWPFLSLAIRWTPPIEADTNAVWAVTDVKYPASFVNWDILDPDTIKEIKEKSMKGTDKVKTRCC